ncbi:MAG: HDOD domain-containing protein [Planctomycetes bacterium]|nr:HDOD domain-containing protein [Planctomycetota bacterium]
MTTTTTPASDLSRLFARQITEKKIELPILPTVATEVMSLCQQDSTDAQKLSGVIHRDQTIASNVLRVANSAAYVGQMPCASLQQAVSRLGLQLIAEIAMAVSVRGRVFGNAACADLLKQLWKHSVITGFYTKEIARLRRRNVEIAFLCGLLHDIGKAVLLNNVDRAIGKTAVELPMDDLTAALHEQHTAAGALLATLWKLPEQIGEAMVYHHDFDQAPKFADTAMMVCLADLLSHMVSPDPNEAPMTADAIAQHPVLAALNIYPDQLQELANKGEKAQQVAEGMS